MDAAFLGRYRFSLNANNQAIIPKPFLAQFQTEQGQDNRDGYIVLFPEDPYAELYTQKTWDKVYQELIAENEKNPSQDYAEENSEEHTADVIRELQENTFFITIDKTGRLTLPASIREALNISKDLILIGFGDHVEIWSADAYDQRRKQTSARSSAALKGLKSSLIQSRKSKQKSSLPEGA